MNRLRNLYLFVGPSGTGKSTIVQRLCDIAGLQQVVSYTTRPRRNNDEGGHLFLSAEKYPTWKKIEHQYHHIVARTVYNGYFYFCTQEQIDNADLYIVDPPGVETLRKNYRGRRRVRIIYVKSPNKELVARMVARGNTPAEAEERILLDQECFIGQEESADYVAYNVDLNVCVWDILEYIRQEERV